MNPVIEKSIEVLKQGEWTKETLARDKEGNKVAYNNPEACQFCLIGALNKAEGLLNANREFNTASFHFSNAWDNINSVLRKKYSNEYDGELAHWNDGVAKSKEEVIQVLEEAGKLK